MSSARLSDVSVLVVEDDPANARMLAALCASEGARVHIAHNATEALQVLESAVPQVAIVDLILPEMSGLVLVQLLKSRPATAGIVTIATSIINGPDLERLAVQIGCAAFVPKPIDVEKLTALIVTNLKNTE